MADHRDVLQGIVRKQGVSYPVLTPNIKVRTVVRLVTLMGSVLMDGYICYVHTFVRLWSRVLRLLWKLEQTKWRSLELLPKLLVARTSIALSKKASSVFDPCVKRRTDSTFGFGGMYVYDLWIRMTLL